MTETRLIRIGEFSTLTRLSVRMLRYYDANGVLSPAATDDFTGHRFYASSQVRDATLIRQLRDVGFSVSAIAALLPQRDDPEALGRALAVQRDQLVADAEAVRRRIAEIDRLISHTTRRATMADIIITTHPAQLVAALRTKIDSYTDEPKAWARLMEAFEAQGLAYTGEPCGTTFHDPEYRDSDIDIEIWEPVAPGATASEPLVVRELPEQRVAVAAFRGGYDQFGPVNEELAEYITRSGLKITGPMYNRYVVGPGKTDDPAQYLTEICIPVA